MKRVFYATLIVIVVLSISLGFFIENKNLALKVQNIIGSSDVLMLGKANLSRPNTWLLFYSKEDSHDQGKMYGLIPVFFDQSEDVEAPYFMFVNPKNIEREITFTGISDKKIDDIIHVINKIKDHGKGDGNLSLIFVRGRDALAYSGISNQLYIEIPALKIGIKLSGGASIDELEEFEIRMAQERVGLKVH